MANLKRLNILLFFFIMMIIECCDEWHYTEKKSGDTIYVGDYYINSNSDIMRVSNYTSIHGDLIIRGTDLKNLNGLDNLNSITGGLYIGCDRFTFSRLSGDLVDSEVEGCEGNPNLVDIQGLGGLTHVGSNIFSLSSPYVVVVNNPLLTNLDGLSNLKTDGLFVKIEGNDALEDVDGFDNFTHLWGLEVHNNGSLTNLDGFERVQTIDGEIGIWDNASLKNLNGLLNINTYMGDFLIVRSNASLPACEAERLQEYIQNTGWDGTIDITDNDETAICD